MSPTIICGNIPLADNNIGCTLAYEYFVAGTTARAAAESISIQSNTTIRFFLRLRQLIASKLPGYKLAGEVEADKSYFGGIRKDKRGRGAAAKITFFGPLKRGWEGLHSYLT